MEEEKFTKIEPPERQKVKNHGKVNKTVDKNAKRGYSFIDPIKKKK